MINLFNRTNFFYADAHWCKTIHDLSHLLGMETINHIVGPMTPPVASGTAIHRLMGVNEKVHPATIAKAYEILNRRGIQKIGNVIVICGLDRVTNELDINDHQTIKRHVILDEVSPYHSIVAVLGQGRYVGTFLLAPEDFGVCICPERIYISGNREQIHKVNTIAIKGEDPVLSNYLAINAALGLFVFQYLGKKNSITRNGLNPDYLKESFLICRQAISSGKAFRLLQRYVKLSKK